jgi:hypothetical protein
VVRQYLGRGEEARLAAALVQERQRQRQVDRQARQADQQVWEAACEPLADLIARTDLLLRAVLLANGYHQHHHGEWRRRMDATVETASPKAPAPLALQEIVKRAQEGDLSVLPDLRRALDANPQFCEDCGNLATQAENSWLRLLAGKDLLVWEAVGRKLEELRTELCGSAPSPLEKLLVDRVVACWLQTTHADLIFAQARGVHASPGALREVMKRQESSQKRYLAAMKQLALVRKLLRPSVSPLDLATRPVQETRPACGRRLSPVPNVRLAGVN